jgi:hypothetical protein
MRQLDLIMSYCGKMDHTLMTNFLQFSDAKLVSLHANTRKKKHIINILIECLQNMIYHGNEGVSVGPTDNGCLVALGQDEQSYFVWTGNHIANTDVSTLQQRLDEVIALSADDLHSLYLAQLERGELSDKGGAGLGIIRILRESGQQMAYTISKINESYSFFSLQVRINA